MPEGTLLTEYVRVLSAIQQSLSGNGAFYADISFDEVSPAKGRVGLLDGPLRFMRYAFRTVRSMMESQIVGSANTFGHSFTGSCEDIPRDF